MTDTKTELPHYLGHRARLRERFLVDEGASMPDYELLELLLTFAVPRRDVKPMAKDLLKEFGSFAGVMNATQYQLLEAGVSVNIMTVFKIVVAAAHKMAAQELKAKDEPVIANVPYLVDYCRMIMGHLDIEEFRIFFLDNTMHIIKERVMQRGTKDAVAFHPREIVRAVLEYGARHIIMVHNHPGGKASPSKQDRLLTDEIVDALMPLNITVWDHLIITKNNYFSFRTNNLV